MEHGSNELFKRLAVELEDSPEYRLEQSFATFDMAQDVYLGTMLLCAKNRTNPVGKTLIRASGHSLAESFAGCFETIVAVESDRDEQTGLVAWLLLHENTRHVDFMNAHRDQTRLVFQPHNEAESALVAGRVLASHVPIDAALRFFGQTLTSDTDRFIQNYK